MIRNATAYEDDFYAWTQEQARLLRSGQVTGLDLEHLAEEIESMGSQQRREMRSRLIQLLLHLLKWQYQPSHRGRSWRHSIRNQRDEIGHLVKASPSLKPVLEDLFAEAYAKARLDAADETGLPLKTFPDASPISLIEAFDPLFPSDLGGPEQELARSQN
jgi:hypothetical protein